jgi:hypothetical protein
MNIHSLIRMTASRSALLARTILLAAGLLQPGWAYGSLEDDAAKEATASHAYAKARAQSLVQEDFNRAIESTLAQFTDTSSQTAAALQFLEQRKAKLVNDLEKFSETTLADLQESKKSFDEIHAQYVELLREHYRLTWVAVEAGEKIQNLAPLFRDSLAKLETQCRLGRSDLSVETGMAPGPRYVPQYEVRFGYGTSGAQFEYKGLSPRAPQRSKTLTDISQYGTAVGSVGLNLPPPYGAPVAAIGYGVAAVSALTNHLLTWKDDSEALAELDRASSIRFAQWARDPEVKKYYQAACQDFASALQPSQRYLAGLTMSAESANQVREELKKNTSAMLLFESQLTVVRAARCRIKIRQAIAHGQSVTSEEKSLCALAESAEAASAQKIADEKLLASAEKTISRTQLLEYAAWKSAIAFDVGLQTTAASLSSTAWTAINETEIEAMGRYTEALSLAMQLRRSIAPDTSFGTLVRDLQERERVLRVRDSMITFSAKTIKAIFKRISAQDWQKAQTELLSIAKPVFEELGYLPEVRELQKSYDRLIRIIEEPS